MNNSKKWFIHTLISLPVGFILGYLLVWLWFFFRLFFLGYGDSGPSWIIMINRSVFIAGLAIGIIGGQIVYFAYRRRIESANHKGHVVDSHTK
jgi:hypothetical protein